MQDHSGLSVVAPIDSPLVMDIQLGSIFSAKQVDNTARPTNEPWLIAKYLM